MEMAFFDEYCDKEDIQGLNKLKMEGLEVTGNLKRDALMRSIYNGRLETVKWLFGNSVINVSKLKLFQEACIKKQFNIAEWLHNTYNLKIKNLKKEIIDNLMEDNDISDWFNKMIMRERKTSDEFTLICLGKNITDVNNYYKNNKHNIDVRIMQKILYEACSKNNLKLIKWFYDNNLVKSTKELLTRSLEAGYIMMSRWIYYRHEIRMSDINYTKILENTKSKKIKSFIDDRLNEEKIYFEFLNLCKKGTLTQVKHKYKEHVNLLIDQGKKDKTKNYFLEYSLSNMRIFKWIMQQIKVNKHMLIYYLKKTARDCNKNISEAISSELSKTDRERVDMDDALIYLCEHSKYESIRFLLSLGYKIKNELDTIGAHIIIFGALDFAQSIQAEYNYLNDKENFIYVFLKCCGFGFIEKVKWMYSLRIHQFSSSYDRFYEESIQISCDTDKKEVAIWLASLFDRYDIYEAQCVNHTILTYVDVYEDSESEDSSYDNSYDDESEEEYYNDLFDIVLENKDSAYELLNITNTYENKNEDRCLICFDTPRDLIKLNCAHFMCVECICRWYKQNEDKCTYCKKDIVWSDCSRLNN